MQAALTGLALAALVAVTGLIPYLASAAKAALVTYAEGKHNAALDAGADTIVVAHQGSALSVQAGLLASRFPGAMAALGQPAESILQDKLLKARVRMGIAPPPVALGVAGSLG